MNKIEKLLMESKNSNQKALKSAREGEETDYSQLKGIFYQKANYHMLCALHKQNEAMIELLKEYTEYDPEYSDS